MLRDYRSFFSLQTGKKKWRGRVVKFSSREPQRFILRTKLSETKTRRNQRKECLFGLRFPPVAPFSLFRQSVKKKRRGEPLDFQFLPPPLPPFDKIAQRARKLADQVDDRFAVSPYSSFTLDKSVSNNSKKRKRNEWKTTRRRFPSRVV